VQQSELLRRSSDVVRRSPAALAPEGHVGVRRRWNLAGITLDRARAGRTAEGRSTSIVADEEECLGGIVRIRTWLAHMVSYCFYAAVHPSAEWVNLDRYSVKKSHPDL
jgi:hypothetical protein